MRLVAYFRVSSTGQLDGYGFDVQRADVKRWAKANGHTIVAEFTDAVTGKFDAPDRPGLTEAVQMVRRPAQADGIVVGKLDRLARALTVQEAILALVWREGGSVFTAEDGEVQQDDPDDPMRTAIRQVQGVFAELDRKTVVKRLRDGRKAKAATGRKAVGEYPYGYAGQGQGRERDAAPEPAEQAAVRRIVELHGEQKSYRVIAATLDAEGHRPRRAASWSAMSVRNVVLRETKK
ncbi:recombinase family protein [Actinosynnema pretiosum]|uniref:Resolvase n=1 Tax=Actinosynnema pretiosum TaxID=42197 RepID=A0A290YZD1_9PSEU|nr:recombinase family protein [Actinosynnema pretiosum]ATE52104.1 resolvase [Actinosynnema pretiosum]